MNVFISYSSIESDRAYELKAVLEGNGISCWMAPNSIPAGSDYGVEIPKAIHNCDVFILILSTAAQESVWVTKEVDAAISNRKPIIPVHIDQSALEDAFNFRLNNVQRIEAFERVSEAYEILVNRLKAILPNESGLANPEMNPSAPGTVEDSASAALQGTSQNICPISFNSLPERSYIQAKEARPGLSYKNGPIHIEDEKEYWVLTTVLNMCPVEKKLAENVRLRMSIDKVSDRETVIISEIICDNATPKSSKHQIKFISEHSFDLVYYKGSAYLYSRYYGLHGDRGIQISDDIMRDCGAQLGFWQVDGIIPGGLNNEVTVSVKLRVERHAD